MKILLIGLGLVVSFFCHAQQPVQWNYSSVRINDTTYEIHLTALLSPGWHIYSQFQPEEGIAEPTKIFFNKTPVVSLEGPLRESGELIKHKYEDIGVVQNEYLDKIDFIQKVKVRNGIKTRVEGVLEYQVCSDRCVPGKVNFSIPILP